MIGHAAAAVRNAFLSPGFRRFGLSFARDYLRFAWRVARRWGDTGPGVVRWMGGDVRYTNRSSLTFLVHEIFVSCAYDFEPARPDPLIVDCGGNIGVATLFFRRRFHAARVVVVEPHPEAFRLLEENTRALADGIQRIQAAVTEDGGPAVLIAPAADDASLMSTIDGGLEEVVGDATRTEVPGISLSALLARLDEEVDFLKLDIEGAEYGAMRDCARTGALARVREVALEYHHTPSEPGGPELLVQVLRESGFDEITVDEGISGVDGVIRARRTRSSG
ncbi:MAG TPA: FkbM family methyltransferase [Longimicrobium sp.]|jgi:FkbM family methyltransferase|nr:FkbM family methyltransferase [Longimicrobium sp.]